MPINHTEATMSSETSSALFTAETTLDAAYAALKLAQQLLNRTPVIVDHGPKSGALSRATDRLSDAIIEVRGAQDNCMSATV